MNKFNSEEAIEKESEDNFDPTIKSLIESLKHPSSYSKKMLSQIAIKAMVIIGEEGQKRVIADMKSEGEL